MFKFLNKKRKRLFLTTGNLSLINANCYIHDCLNKNFENLLYIGGCGSKQFIEHNNIIANFGNYKKIIFEQIDTSCKNHPETISELIKKNKLNNVNEVVCVCHWAYLNVINQLFPNAKLSIIFESLPIFKCDGLVQNKISTLYLNNYLGKLDYPFKLKRDTKILKTNQNNYKKYITQIRKNLNLQIKLPKEGKWVLLCGAGFTQKFFGENINEKFIKLLKTKGYEVMFKKHPRDSHDYSYLRGEVELLEESYQIEFYNLSDFVGVCAYNSNLLYTLPDLGIPTFAIIIDEMKKENPEDLSIIRFTYIAENYALPFEELLNADLNKSTNELQKHFLNKLKERLKNKPVLSKNQIFLEKFGNVIY